MRKVASAPCLVSLCAETPGKHLAPTPLSSGSSLASTRQWRSTANVPSLITSKVAPGGRWGGGSFPVSPHARTVTCGAFFLDAEPVIQAFEQVAEIESLSSKGILATQCFVNFPNAIAATDGTVLPTAPPLTASSPTNHTTPANRETLELAACLATPAMVEEEEEDPEQNLRERISRMRAAAQVELQMRLARDARRTEVAELDEEEVEENSQRRKRRTVYAAPALPDGVLGKGRGDGEERALDNAPRDLPLERTASPGTAALLDSLLGTIEVDNKNLLLLERVGNTSCMEGHQLAVPGKELFMGSLDESDGTSLALSNAMSMHA